MKSNFNNYIKILRPKNLVIVAISQFLIYWVYIFPLTSKSGITLNGGLWWLFIIDTVLIAAGGYVINDIFDQKADLLNKPEKLFIGSQGISVKNAWIYYQGIVIVGFLIASFIAFQIDKIHLLAIYPIATLLLFLYSRSWKKAQLIGNLVVATFCAFVPGIIWYAEYDNLKAIETGNLAGYNLTTGLLVAYIIFAFFSTVVREMVKDMEDADGDRKAGYRTFPILAGMDIAKNSTLRMGVLLLFSYFLWFRVIRYFVGWIVPSLMVLGLAIFTIVIIWKLYKSNTKEDFGEVSKWLKLLMVISLFVFLCIPLFINIR